MKSHDISVNRESLGIIKKKFNFLKDVEYINKILHSLPYLAAILNHNRQVIMANKKLLELINIEQRTEIQGKLPGEILHCINADKEIGGCGHSKNCTVCGAVNCFLEAQRTNKIKESECRITSKNNGDGIIAYDFKVITTPFQSNGETFYMFSLIDISSEKRRRTLERLFFHDILNKTGSLNGLIDLMKQYNDVEKLKEFIDYLDGINKDLNEEIISQRDLTAAESGELNVDFGLINSKEIITSCADLVSHHEAARNNCITIDTDSVSLDFNTDEVLLKRILINMLKNALEASQPDDIVSIGCFSENGSVRFQVHNDSYIPEEQQLQIFQRSFSTKGPNRGLGTYSIKLLGESYLKGKVGFTSDLEKGTDFYINLQV